MYTAKDDRYENMTYRRCGKSGIRLSCLSLGLWHNFGDFSSFANMKEMAFGAFDMGITHFDLANNYGPEPGSAEKNFGRILKEGLGAYRDELFISSKAGFYMWPGPFGEWGSKKNIVASCDQSLKRMGLDYVDLFYHHRPDADTPLEETMDALCQLIRDGKALYVGISNYSAEDTKKATQILKAKGVHLFSHQPSYSMYNRWVEDGLLDVLEEEGVGAICFSALAQGMLSDRYFDGIPADSRAAGHSVFLSPEGVDTVRVEKSRRLNEIAKQRGQTLAQMALSWCLRQTAVASVIVGASKLSQIRDSLKTQENLAFTAEELAAIEAIL